MTKQVLPLRLTDRARRAQAMMHATPGLLLILTGLEGLLSGKSHRPWIDGLGILAGLLLVIMLRRELRSKHATHTGVHWYDVIVGCVIILEGAHKLHKNEWFQPSTILMLVGVLMIVIGFFHHKLELLRRLEWDDERFCLHLRPLYRFSMKWSDLDSVKLDGTTLILTNKSKKTHSVNLRRIENRGEVGSAIEEQMRAGRGPAPTT
jgi:hypothetical protein